MTGEIVALMPCSVSATSNRVLIGVPGVFTVKKYKPCVASKLIQIHSCV